MSPKNILLIGLDPAVVHYERRPGLTAEKLAETDYACILIGAGVRADIEEFHLFEKLINTVHEHAPGTKICFNTGPTDSVDAVKRWI